MGKWLRHLDEIQPHKNHEPTESTPTKPTKDLSYPFVGANPALSEKIKHGESTHQERAESMIDQLELHDDRVFVRRCLIGIYGADRLAAFQRYLAKWNEGAANETNAIKKQNAGRFRANCWLRKFSSRG